MISTNEPACYARRKSMPQSFILLDPSVDDDFPSDLEAACA